MDGFCLNNLEIDVKEVVDDVDAWDSSLEGMLCV